MFLEKIFLAVGNRRIENNVVASFGNSLGTTVNAYNQAYKELAKVDKDVMRVTDGDRTIEPLALDRPQMEEPA